MNFMNKGNEKINIGIRTVIIPGGKKRGCNQGGTHRSSYSRGNDLFLALGVVMHGRSFCIILDCTCAFNMFFYMYNFLK